LIQNGANLNDKDEVFDALYLLVVKTLKKKLHQTVKWIERTKCIIASSKHGKPCDSEISNKWEQRH